MMIFNRNRAVENIGQKAERIAKEHLEKHGLRVVEKNFRSRHGEIDLIMEDEQTLVFVEVRFRSKTSYGSPLESVTSAKQRKIQLTAQHYLSVRSSHYERPIRFDVVGIIPNEINWIKGAF